MSKNKELKAITSAYAKDFKNICERSREERLKSLQPGDPMPREGVLYGDDARERFMTRAAAHRAKALSIVDGELAKLKDEMTKAPSTDAVNTLTLLKMRNKITPEDLRPIMERYGDNNQVYDTLRDIAAQHEIRDYAFESNPLRVKAEKLNGLKSSLNNNLRIDRAEKGYANDGFMSFLDAVIDDALPEE